MRKKREGAGRKKLLSKVDGYIGFDLGGTKLASGLVTVDGRVLATRRDNVEFTAGKEGFLRFLGDIAEEWLRTHPEVRVRALGIASCGPLDIEHGILHQPTNFPRWGRIEVARALKARLGIPVYMHNDAAAAAAAEGWRGGARRVRNWMVLTFGTGLGTGIVMDRKLFMGGAGMGPEAGHLIITDRTYRCGCGNFGCAEAVLSGTALRRRIAEQRQEWARSNLEPPVTPEELVARARNGDRVALAIFEEFAAMLARAVHNYAVLFAPQKIFLAGGLGDEADLYLPRTLALVADHLKSRPEIAPQICVSKLGSHIGVLGGAWVADFRVLKKNDV